MNLDDQADAAEIQQLAAIAWKQLTFANMVEFDLQSFNGEKLFIVATTGPAATALQRVLAELRAHGILKQELVKNFVGPKQKDTPPYVS